MLDAAEDGHVCSDLADDGGCDHPIDVWNLEQPRVRVLIGDERLADGVFNGGDVGLDRRSADARTVAPTQVEHS